jgi:hypothetical protein
MEGAVAGALQKGKAVGRVAHGLYCFAAEMARKWAHFAKSYSKN